ncbi:MAG: hypothetical protein IJU72_08690 [Bacteroidales bacterium]|nr:hypothetical protein [Bacteroidales bacterium]
MSYHVKNIGLTLIIGLISACAVAQSRADLMTKELIVKNKVKSVSQWNHKIVKDKVDPKGYISVITTYDSNGNVVQVENLKSDGSKSSTHEYTYDKNGNKVAYVQHQLLGGKWTMSYRQIITYDHNGRKVAEDGFDGTTNYKILLTYYPDGKQESITKSNAFGRVDEKWIYTHNGNETRIEVQKQGKPNRTVIKKFDSKGQLTEETTLKPDGSELNKSLFGYDGNGAITTKEEFYGGKPKAKYDYKYSGTNLTEITQTATDGKPIVFRSYKYDKQGNMVEEQWFDGQEDDYSNRKIQLDNNGNVNQVETYYSDYKYKVVYRYTYKFN